MPSSPPGSTLNGNREITGTAWVDDSGFLNGPVMITNTQGSASSATRRLLGRSSTFSHMEGYWRPLPVVAETCDGYLNDISGFYATAEDAFHALDVAHSGPVEDGNVGAGAGVICNDFEGSIGPAPACSMPKIAAIQSVFVCNQTTALGRCFGINVGR